jgi:HTH-type transcriptional regulator, transcriptional repressor of NAD biosynthesis genes
MKRGLVIGKFLPIHNGHISLINFAASKCDEVIVSMSYTANDIIDPSLRFSWIKEIFNNNSIIKPAMVLDNFDDETLPLYDRTKVWAKFIAEAYPAVDAIFSSEEYGEPFAKHLGAQHFLYDLERKETPVSATLIREKPFGYWNFIPEIVRPYFVKKICFYGAESTGKSWAAKKMAHQYQTEFVPEVAREIIKTNTFSVQDIIKIGQAHHDRIQQKLKTSNKVLFCDTDAITTQIYSNYYLGVIPAELYEFEHQSRYEHYFLFDIDVPWVADGLRDLGEKRPEMFAMFKEALDQRKLSYTVVSGPWHEREFMITEKINSILLAYS